MRNYIILSAILVVVSCGGGGGSSTSTPTQATSTPTTVPSTTAPTCDDACFQARKDDFEALYEYSTQYGLGISNASSAYARGATGEGMIVGVVDSGLDDSHPEITPLKVQAGSYLNYSNYMPTTKQKRHGTAVSSIAIGKSSDDGSPMHGVAFDAKVFFIAVQLGSAPEDYDPVDLGDSSGEGAPDYSGVDNFYDQVFEVFINNSVDVVNNSFGFTGTINEYTEAQLRTNFPNTIARISQSGVLDANKTLFVWAAGNTGQYADQGADYSSPDVFPGMAYVLSELQGHSLAVVSVDEDGVISDFSSRCGVAKDFCLAAPGEGIVVAYATSMNDTGIFDATDDCVSNNSCYAVGGGTSYAAPFVSGGLALLAQHFNNQLGNTEILQRILMTADKSGIYADESIYGQGLMDLDAASKPVGQTMIAVTSSLKGLHHTELGTSIGTLGPAFGDAFTNAMSTKNIVVFDQLGAPFIKKLDSTYLNNLPSLAWLSSKQSNPSRRVLELKTNTNRTTELMFGLASNRYGEHDLFMSLWAKDDKKLQYFSLKKELSDSSFYFFGNGLSPSLFFGDEGVNTSFSNVVGKASGYGSPFLDFAARGSFVGGGMKLGNGAILSGAYFKGNHEEEEMSVIKIPSSSGVLIEYKEKYNNSLMALQVGVLEEPDSFMGSSFSGGYGSIDKTLTYFSGLQASRSFQKFYATGSLFYGKTQTNLSETGLIESLDRFTSSSFNLGIFKKSIFDSFDSFGFKIIQPLRLEEANIEMSVPVRRTKYKEVLFDKYDLSLTPSGREIRAEFIYQRPIPRGSFFTSLGYIKDQGHVSSDKAEPYISANWQFYLF